MKKEGQFHTRVDGTKVKNLSDLSGNNFKFGLQAARFVLQVGKMCLTRVLFAIIVVETAHILIPWVFSVPKKIYDTKNQLYIREKDMIFKTII